MAYFAQIDNDGTVLQVISVSNEEAPDPATEHSEPIGQEFIANVLRLAGEWRQTSYNSNFRKQYAGIGFTYDAEADVFIAPQPFPSWSLDANHDWQAPVPYPGSGNDLYRWQEETLSWVSMSVT